jgi:hypothetical protein
VLDDLGDDACLVVLRQPLVDARRGSIALVLVVAPEGLRLADGSRPPRQLVLALFHAKEPLVTKHGGREQVLAATKG